MPSTPSPLVGRALLLATISGAMRAGRGTVLTGPSGSGGTRVLAEAHTAARRSGLRVAHLRPVTTDGDGPVPFLPLLDQAALAALPDLHPATVHAATLALGLHAVFLDDAHRLDDATGALVLGLAREGTAIVANASGGTALPGVLRRLVDEGRVTEAALEPLTDDEIAEVAEDLLGDPVEPALAVALAAASGGRPRTLAEVVDDAVGSRSVVHAEGVWRMVAALPAARSVRAAVLDAFSALTPEQRGWVAAVAQAGVLADDLARRIAAAEAIDAADEAGWTVRDSARAGTRIASQPIGAAVLAALDPRARIAVLRRLIAATEASERPLDDAERIAVTRWRAEVGLPVDALAAWQLARLPDTDVTTREVLLRAAVDGGAPADADLADLLRRTRRPAQALELIDAALRGARDDADRVALLRVRTMTTGIIERNPSDALRMLDEQPIDHDTQPDLLAVRASMLLMEARPAEALAIATAAAGAEASSGFARAFGRLQMAMAHRELGRLDAALVTARDLLELDSVDDGFPDSGALARWLPSELAVAVGADPDAVEAQLVAARESVAPEHRTTHRPALSYTLAGVHLLKADPGAAVRLLREAESGGGAWRESWLPRILSELTIAQALSGALDEAVATRERLLRLTCPPVHRGRVDLASAQVLHQRGASDAARSLARSVADRARASGLALDAFDGELAALRYGDEQAPQRLLDLGPYPSGSGRDLERRYAAALMTGDADAVDRASMDLWDGGLRLLAIEAAHRAASLGSSAAATRLVAWLARTCGLRLVGVGDRRAPGLTAREREVAVLAAQGASDRTIAAELDITLRTAQTHLGRALGKLGVHRRTELRGLVVEP